MKPNEARSDSVTARQVAMMAHYTLVANLSAYVQFNRGYPRDRLGLIYMIGDAFVFVAARLAGWLSDRDGTPPIALFGTTLYAAVLIFGFIYPWKRSPCSWASWAS